MKNILCLAALLSLSVVGCGQAVTPPSSPASMPPAAEVDTAATPEATPTTPAEGEKKPAEGAKAPEAAK